MLTVHATLQPDGRVQLPPALAKGRPMPVLVTILEPLPEMAQPASTPTAAIPIGKGSVTNLLALLQSPEFLALPKAGQQELDEHIQSLRNDWNDA